MRFFTRLLFLPALLLLTACHHPLHDYVQRVVKLDTSKLNSAEEQVIGSVDYSSYTYEPYDEWVCDSYICGYDRHYQCRSEPRCGYVDGRYVCEGEHRYCDWIDVPRYCDTNCRMERRTRSIRHDHTSLIKAKIEGLPNDAKIEELTLGLGTNEEFRRAIKDPSRRPSEYRELFDTLRDTDRTLLLMKGEGVELVPDEGFLQIPNNFQNGDMIHLQIKIRESTGKKLQESIIGTEKRVSF